MSSYSVGDQVIAARGIGGVLRPTVPEGSPGVVVKAGLFSATTVRFSIPGLLGLREVETTVEDYEITRA
ncbi:hypothetical protein [Longimycelium tulufanense]|nr:hypothetical protein [Longimycelium tulufanense]